MQETTPDYAQPGTQGFVPSLWDAALIEALDPQLVFASGTVSNRSYTGQITRKGDRVYVNALTDPTLSKYNAVDGLTAENVETIVQAIDITEADAIAVRLDDIEVVQTAGPLAEPIMRRMVHVTAKAMDTFVGSVAAASATDYGEVDASTGTPAQQGEIILEAIFDQMQSLDEADIPASGRWVVVSPRVKRYLVRAEAVANASAFGEGGVTRNGLVARLAGFTILSTTNMPSGVDMIAGQQDFLTVADQFTGFRDVELSSHRATQLDSLHLYGAKVVRFPGLDSVTGNAFDETQASKGIIKATVKTEADTSG